MALEGTNALIPLQAGRNLPQMGPDWQTIQANQQMSAQIQKQQSAQEATNALKWVYSDPSRFDHTTLQPKPEVFAQMAGMSAPAAMDLRNNLVAIQGKQLTQQHMQSEVIQDWDKEAMGIGKAAFDEYKAKMTAGVPPPEAMQAGQTKYTELLDPFKAGKPPSYAARLSPTFDPIRIQNNQLTLAQQAAAKKAQQEASIPEYAVPMPYGGGESKSVPVIPDQNNPGKWVTADTGKPVTDLTGIHKIGSKNEGATVQPHIITAQTTDGQPIQLEQTAGGGLVNALTRKPVDPETIKPGSLATSKEKHETLHPSKEIAIVDKDGNVVERFAARESAAGAGWVRSSDGSPVTVPAGGKIDVGQAAGAVIGSRENVYIGRILEGGITATTDLENISKMPVSVSSGMFGGRKQGPGLIDATKEVLANKLTTQDVQIYNSANTGIQRALAVIESSGLAPSGAFTEQFNGLTLKEGDSQLTRLYKMANARQIVENGMEVIRANPRVAPEQKKLADRFVERVQTAIPWTTGDVIKLQTSSDPAATLHNLGVAKTTGEPKKESAAPAAAAAAAAAPAGTPTIEPPAGTGAIAEPKTPADAQALPAGTHYRRPDDPPGTWRVR